MRRSPVHKNPNPPKRPYTEVSPTATYTSSAPSSVPINNTPTDQNMINAAELKSIVDKCLDEHLKNIATKGDVSAISKEIQLLRKENAHLTERLSTLESYCNTLERQLEMVSQKSNEKTVVMHFPSDKMANKLSYATQTCLGLLNLNENADIGIQGSQEFTNQVTKKTTMVLNFGNTDTVSKIINAAHKLKNTGTFVHREHSLLYRNKRRNLFDIRGKLLSKNENIKIFIKGAKMQIENFTFAYDSFRGLKINTNRELEFIKSNFGDDAAFLFDINDINIANVNSNHRLRNSAAQETSGCQNVNNEEGAGPSYR